MKTKLILLIAVTSLIVGSCSKKRTCVCTETYKGENSNYSNETEHEFEKMKKDEATQKCETMNITEQVILGESYAVDCELK